MFGGEGMEFASRTCDRSVGEFDVVRMMMGGAAGHRPSQRRVFDEGRQREAHPFGLGGEGTQGRPDAQLYRGEVGCEGQAKGGRPLVYFWPDSTSSWA